MHSIAQHGVTLVWDYKKTICWLLKNVKINGKTKHNSFKYQTYYLGLLAKQFKNRCFSKADIEKGKICLLQRLVCCSSSARNRSMRAGWCCDPLRGLRGCSSRSPSCAPRSACLAVFRAFGESCSLVCSGTTEKEADRTIVLVWALSGRAIYPMQISRLSLENNLCHFWIARC